jgi:hypothetical protein
MCRQNSHCNFWLASQLVDFIHLSRMELGSECTITLDFHLNISFLDLSRSGVKVFHSHIFWSLMMLCFLKRLQVKWRPHHDGETLMHSDLSI